MITKRAEMKRREFLKKVLGGAAIVAAVGAGKSAAETRLEAEAALKKQYPLFLFQTGGISEKEMIKRQIAQLTAFNDWWTKILPKEDFFRH